MHGPNKAGSLCVKPAREAFFRQDILQQCTVRGCRDLPALPVEELGSLKQVLFRKYEVEFEPVWNKFVNHSCKSVRMKTTYYYYYLVYLLHEKKRYQYNVTQKKILISIMHPV